MIVVLFFVVMATFCSAKETRVSAMELLDKYSATADKAFSSFVFKTKTKIFKDDNYTGEWAYRNGKRTRYSLQELRSDGRRLKWIGQQWGEIFQETLDSSGRLL